jgi:hypothetical protein
MLHRFLTLLLSAMACAVCSQPLQAQTPSSSLDHDKQFYLFTSYGHLSGVEVEVVPRIRIPSTDSWQLGGGAEWFVVEGSGLAFGGELAVTPREPKSTPITYTYRTTAGDEASNTFEHGGVRNGWFKLNMSYHFKELSRRKSLVPFVTAGVAVFAFGGPTEAFNYGGGVSIWRSRRRGWRLEYSKFVVHDENTRFRGVSVGLMLR